MVRRLFVFTCIWQKNVKILKNTKGLLQCKCGPSNDVLVSRSKNVLYHFLITIFFHLDSFYAKKYFKKKLGFMFIEQILKFELKEPGPTGRLTKKSLRKISEGIIYCQNIARCNVPHFPVPGPNHLQNLTPKCKILNLLWT